VDIILVVPLNRKDAKSINKNLTKTIDQLKKIEQELAFLSPENSH